MDEPKEYGNKRNFVEHRSQSYYGNARVHHNTGPKESETSDGRISRTSSHSSIRSKEISMRRRGNSDNECRSSSKGTDDLQRELNNFYSMHYSRHGDEHTGYLSSKGTVSSMESFARKERKSYVHSPAGESQIKNGSFNEIKSKMHNFQRGSMGIVEPRYNMDTFNDMQIINETGKRKGRLQRSQSTDLSLIHNKRRGQRQQNRQSYSLGKHDFSKDVDFHEHTTRKAHSHRRSHSDIHSLRKLSKHQKYFYNDDIDKITESNVSPLHVKEDHNFHSIRDSRDVRVDLDLQIRTKDTVLADDDYSFPALEGYRRHGLKHSFPSAPFKPLKYDRGNLCLAILSMILTLLSGFMIFCPMFFILLIILPLCCFLKKICSCCCCYNKCEYGQLLTSHERKLFDQDSSTNVSHGLLFVEYGLDLHRIRDLINARIICAEDKSKVKLYPKFTKKIALTCSGAAWIPDHCFFINNHVYSMPKTVENFEDLQEYVSECSSKPMSIQSPLWEIQVLKNFGDQRETVLFVRVHPIVADGVTLVQSIYASLTDMDSIACSVPKFSHQGRFLNNMKAFFLGPLIYFLQYMCSRSDFNMLHGKHVHRSGHHVVSWSEPFSLEKANRIKQVTRSTLNDVFLSAASGSLRTYLRVNGIDHPYDMKAMLPVHYLGGWEESPVERNKYLFLSIPIPTNTEGAIPRLWRVKRIMDNISNTALFSVTQGALWLTSILFPEKLFSKFWKNNYSKCTCVISNVPGPETTLKFGSREVKAMMCWMPPQENIAIAITFVTYGEQVRMSVITDRSVLPNPEMIANDFIYQMTTLNDLLANRRIPSEYVSRRAEPVELDCEIRAEQTVDQLQRRMSLIQQEIHDLKVQLDLEKHGKETKIMKRIDTLKEQFRELLVEMRQRRAAEVESAVILSSDDDIDDELDEDGEPRRPLRRRTLSISSRLSTVSQSSTVRPLAAAPASAYEMTSDTDSMSEASFRMDGISQVGRVGQYRRQYSEQPKKFEILDYASSPSMERRYRTY